MFILSIETTGPHCSAALIDEKGGITMEKSEERLNHLQVLTPIIDKLMKEKGITKDDICAVAASRGPGSFTGIRIGVSTARALSQVWGIPCIPVPTLYAFGYSRKDEMKEDSGLVVCPVFDARRNQIYGAALMASDDEVREEVVSGPYMLPEFLGLLEDTVLKERKKEDLTFKFLGDGVEKYEDQILSWAEEKGIKVLPEKVYQYADSVAQVALEMYKKGETVGFNSFEPEYMRKAEAQRKLEERLKEQK